MSKILLILSLAFGTRGDGHFLRTTTGTNGHKHFVDRHGQRIFLSGANMAWYRFCRDFGTGSYNTDSEQHFRQFLTDVHDNGGNSVRVWLHCAGHYSPHFDSHGNVDKLSGAGDLIADMRKFLNFANYRKILVFFVLWSGARPVSYDVAGLINSPLGGTNDKLASYLTQLKLMVGRLRFHPALGGWEIMNEIHGSFDPHHHDNGCSDVSGLSGGGWARNYVKHSWQYPRLFTMRQLQIFISRQAAAIHSVDHLAQITTSTTGDHMTNGNWGLNLLNDSCLSQPGGGKLTFYSVHTYANGGQEYDSHSPVLQPSSHYNLDKPLVVGEFSQACSHGRTAATLFQTIYNHNYAGAWIWQWYHKPGSSTEECRGDWSSQLDGMRSISGRTDHGYTKISDNTSLSHN